jgi:hypothetical protein
MPKRLLLEVYHRIEDDFTELADGFITNLIFGVLKRKPGKFPWLMELIINGRSYR